MGKTLEGTLDWLINTPVDRRSLAGKKPKADFRRWNEHAIECDDGVTLSVQASSGHYCSPRTDEGPWYEVEVGFPSIVPPETWMQYMDGGEDPTKTVYGYMPVELVKAFIADHGGEKSSINNDSKEEETA